MFKKFLLALLALFVIFEEWLWDLLTVIGQWLSRVLHLAKFDAWLATTTPNIALLAFLIPVLVTTPFNLLAIYLLAHGAFIQGVLLEVAVKLVGTVLIARVFRLTKNALLTFAWFNALYSTISRLLRWAHDLIHNTAIYQLSVKLKAEIRATIRRWLSE